MDRCGPGMSERFGSRRCYSRIARLGGVLVLLGAWTGAAGELHAANFSRGEGPACKFGVHEVVLTAATPPPAGNPFDVVVQVIFVPPAGEAHAQQVYAFYDGDNQWRARVYASEVGAWHWTSACTTVAQLDGQHGTFAVDASALRGRLLPHPRNPRQWITEDGHWFLNLSDTAYFLLCAQDGNGQAVTDAAARQYVRDDVEHGITAVRCFVACGREGFQQSVAAWNGWYFEDASSSRLRLENLHCADRRLQMLLEEFPEIAVQLILFPLEAYNRDSQFWPTLSAVGRERLLRNLVARFAAYPQLMWLLTNDAHYGPKYPHNNAMVREVGAYLQQHDRWQHPRSTGHARRQPFIFGGETWATYVHIEHEHDLGAAQFAPYAALNKPVFLGEDRYEQDRAAQIDPTNMRYWQRRLFWAWLFSGGSTNYGGRWWTVQPYGETGTREATYRERPANTFRAALVGLDSVAAIRNFFKDRQIDLGDFEPDHGLVNDLENNAAIRALKLMRRGQQEFLVYHPHAAADGKEAAVSRTGAARLRIDLRAAAEPFAVEWYRARDGVSETGTPIEGDREVELTAPWSGEDVVLRLQRK